MRVKVSERNQISLPSSVRKQLNIKPGDYLLMDVQDGSLPPSHARLLALPVNCEPSFACLDPMHCKLPLLSSTAQPR